jgi:hypothetical protein
MAQLTSNTDNKVKKLVMFFAGDTLPSRHETARGKTQRPRSPLRFDTGALPASAVNKITIKETRFCYLSTLYRETYRTQKALYLDGKKPAIPSFPGLRSIVLL